jgi:multicomponent K+:H+ antiporter subunit A
MAAVVAVFHILNHAAFKAALFMAAGIVDHETGTRDLRLLGGLKKAMPFTFALTLIASAAMAGLPPLNGFISKEMFFEEALHLPLMGELDWLIPVIVTVAGLWSVAYSIRLVVGTFLGSQKGELPKNHPHEPPFLMRLPVLVLVALSVLIGLVPSLVEPLVRSAGSAVIGAPAPEFHLSLWHGFNLLSSMMQLRMLRKQWKAYSNLNLKKKLLQLLRYAKSSKSAKSVQSPDVMFKREKLQERIKSGLSEMEL